MSEQPQPIRYGARPMEIWISRVLLAGVILSGTIILAGLVVFLVSGSAVGESLSDLVDRQRVAADLGAILRGIGRGDGTSLIQIGLFVLILTPVSRVAMSIVFFLREPDRVFAAITTVVLAILLAGLITAALTQ